MINDRVVSCGGVGHLSHSTPAHPFDGNAAALSDIVSIHISPSLGAPLHCPPTFSSDGQQLAGRGLVLSQKCHRADSWSFMSPRMKSEAEALPPVECRGLLDLLLAPEPPPGPPPARLSPRPFQQQQQSQPSAHGPAASSTKEGPEAEACKSASGASRRMPKSPLHPGTDSLQLTVRQDEMPGNSETWEQRQRRQLPVTAHMMTVQPNPPPKRSASLGDLLRTSVKSIILANRVSQVILNL